MWTDLIYDPAFWITILSFGSVIVYFYWKQKVKKSTVKKP